MDKDVCTERLSYLYNIEIFEATQLIASIFTIKLWVLSQFRNKPKKKMYRIDTSLFFVVVVVFHFFFFFLLIKPALEEVS